MKKNFSKRTVYLFSVFFLIISSGFLFQNCSPVLYNLQRGVSVRASEDVSDFLKKSENEIKVTKEDIKQQEFFFEEKTVPNRSFSSENQDIIETDTASGKIKLGRRKENN